MDGRPHCVLVVEAGNAAKTWARALAAAGFDVRVAQPDEPVPDIPIDVALVEVSDDGASELMDRVRARPETPRIIAVHDGDPLAVPPQDGHLTKPFGPRALIAEVNRVLGLSAPPQRTGTLGAGGVAPILGELYQGSFTGVLSVRRGEVRKDLHLEAGAVRRLRSNLLTETLGRRLVGDRLISESACSDALARKGGSHLGAVLVEGGHLSERNLHFALESQAQDRLRDLFGWRSGEYVVSPDPTLTGPALLSAHPLTTIFEGLAELDTAEVLAELHDLRRRIIKGLEAGELRDVALSFAADAVQKLDERVGQPLESLFESPRGRGEQARLAWALHLVGGLALGSAPAPRTDRSALGRGMSIAVGGREPESRPAEPPAPSVTEDLQEAPAAPAVSRAPRGLSFSAAPRPSPQPVLAEDLEAPPAASASEPDPPDVLSAGTLDLEGEAIAFERLRERYDAFVSASPRQRLNLGTGPLAPEEVDRAYVEARGRLQSDLAEGRTASGRCAHLAEAAELALIDARQALLNEDVEFRSRAPAPPVEAYAWRVAVERYEAALAAFEAGETEIARAGFAEAAQFDPSVETYRHAVQAVEGEGDGRMARIARARSVGTPEAWQAVLEVDPDHPEALAKRPEPPAPVRRWGWGAR